MLKNLLKRKAPKTGVSCHYCGWNGLAEDLRSAKVLNTDGTPYSIAVCPDCGRNGGLDYHDGAPH